MNQWPDGGTDNDNRGRYGLGSAGPQPEPTRVMPHVRRGDAGVPAQSRGGYGSDHGYGNPDYPGQDPNQGQGYHQGQVHGAPPPGGPPPSGGGSPYPPGSRPAPRWGRRIKFGLLALVIVLLVTTVGTYFWADSKLNREVDLSKVEDRPEGGKGTNYLIVGSDSREGLSEDQKKDLHTGGAGGRRTDTMMILHVGDNGNTMISLPRDSYVTIPEFTGSVSGRRIPAQQQKLNAAFSIEGPELLVRTVEYNTGLKIDHYAEIGFAGFANVVDAVGGVEMCLDKAIKDKNSGADFQKGCQTLDGADSLAFVRQRYQEAEGDLGRTKNQQKFLSALASQAATPSTVLNPFKLYPTMGAGLDTLIVDKDMGLWDLTRLFWAMKGVSGGDGTQMNIPISGNISTRHGSALKWDMPKVKQLMKELKNDEKVTVKPQ